MPLADDARVVPNSFSAKKRPEDLRALLVQVYSPGHDGSWNGARLAVSSDDALIVPVSSEKSLRQGKWHSRRQISDVVAAAAYTVPAVAVAIIIPEPQGTVFVLSLLAVVASGTALLFGRRAPMFSLVATAGIMLITFSVPGSFAAVATALALYAVAVFGSVRQAIFGLLGISTILVLAAVLLPRSMGDINQVVPAIAVLLIATLIGLNVRTRRRYVVDACRWISGHRHKNVVVPHVFSEAMEHNLIIKNFFKCR